MRHRDDGAMGTVSQCYRLWTILYLSSLHHKIVILIQYLCANYMWLHSFGHVLCWFSNQTSRKRNRRTARKFQLKCVDSVYYAQIPDSSARFNGFKVHSLQCIQKQKTNAIFNTLCYFNQWMTKQRGPSHIQLAKINVQMDIEPVM